MSQNNEHIEWYIARDGQQHGPLSQAELDKFIEFGHLRPTDLLWRAGFPDWRVASDVFPSPPAAPPSAQRAADFDGEAADGGAQQATGGARSPEPRADRAQETVSSPGGEARRHDVGTSDSWQQEAPHGPATGRGPGVIHQNRAGGDTQPSASFADAWQEAEARSGQHSGGPAVTAHPQHGPTQPGRQPRGPVVGADPGAASTEAALPAGVGASLDRGPRGFQGGSPENVPRPDVSLQGPGTEDDDYEEDDNDYEDAGRSSWIAIAATVLILGLIGAGGWFAYNNQNQIAALYSDLIGSSLSAGDDVEIIRAPEEATRESADDRSSGTVNPTASQPVREPVTPTTASVSRQSAGGPEDATLANVPILKSEAWSFARREFAPWTSKQLEQAREMAAANESVTAINNHLVNAFVEFRRDNAALALLASSERLENVALAFVASLKALTTEGPDSCYAFISSGEGTESLAPVYFKPLVVEKIDQQMLAIMGAIVDAKSNPSARSAPKAEDFEKLSGELNERGWSDADLKLFSNPDALSRAKPDVVCRLVTEWFATQTRLGDREARDRLIAASLRPVIGG